MNTILHDFRQQFPALANKAYFNYGGQGTMPQGALGAILSAYEYIQHRGPFGLATNGWVNQEGHLTRQAIAGELGVSGDTITLTEDVTVGCNIALWGIEWRSGDRILLSDCEHPGIIAAIWEISRRYGVEIDTFPLLDTLNGGDPIAVITDRLQPRTKLVVLSHVLWNTGQVLPLGEIARSVKQYDRGEESILILVDGAQSFGLLPLNLAELEVDFYAFTGHKWCCGPEGIGGLYVSPDARSRLSPTFIGWRGIDHQTPNWSLFQDGRRYEVATSAYPLYSALRAAIAVHQSWGDAQTRYQQIIDNALYLWNGLQQLSGLKCLNQNPPVSGLVSFQIASKEHDQLVAKLEQNNFYLRTIVSPHSVRACVHYFTTIEEIDDLLTTIGKQLTVDSDSPLEGFCSQLIIKYRD
jgi:L-cysteine/cystine lyase